jgi:putative DNA methylase
MANDTRLIECDDFPFEFLSQLAERESWRKEIHRPVYHVHKWWAKRLGSVFRGILLGCQLPPDADLSKEFYRSHSNAGMSVFDPFMGSGTTIGEAHKLGFTALGRDINPVAVAAVMTGLGPLHRDELMAAFKELEVGVGQRIRQLYCSVDRRGRPCDVLYQFWVMQTACPECFQVVDLFPSYVIARNARPERKPEVQVYCPNCGDIFPGLHGEAATVCTSCQHAFDPSVGPARGTKAHCPQCENDFTILDTFTGQTTRPVFRLYAKLVLTRDGRKEYLRATPSDLLAYERCSHELQRSLADNEFTLPDLALENGYNTRQAMGYGFRSWRDFFNDRQLLALNWLQQAIGKIGNESSRRALLTLFSGVLEFNNLFASYKGEGTGAVRHMFSHHILKPERTPIEANIWGTPKSSGSFSTLFPSRLLRAAQYQACPTEVFGRSGDARVCSPAFTGQIEPQWPTRGSLEPRGVYLSCGDSSDTGLPSGNIDFVVTDPPFFDNVHYSELADFFFAWQQKDSHSPPPHGSTTRHPSEVQDTDANRFASKLQAVFRECHRVLKDDGLLVFSYHHSRSEGWSALASAILHAGFVVVNSQPVKAEMSVGTPKSQAKEPIQFDIVIVCRKRESATPKPSGSKSDAMASAQAKLHRLQAAGFTLSRNDQRIVQYSQLLPLLRCAGDFVRLAADVESELKLIPHTAVIQTGKSGQKLLF